MEVENTQLARTRGVMRTLDAALQLHYRGVHIDMDAGDMAHGVRIELIRCCVRVRALLATAACS
jgi:hypothetical protein